MMDYLINEAAKSSLPPEQDGIAYLWALAKGKAA